MTYEQWITPRLPLAGGLGRGLAGDIALLEEFSLGLPSRAVATRGKVVMDLVGGDSEYHRDPTTLLGCVCLCACLCVFVCGCVFFFVCFSSHTFLPLLRAHEKKIIKIKKRYERRMSRVKFVYHRIASFLFQTSSFKRCRIYLPTIYLSIMKSLFVHPQVCAFSRAFPLFFSFFLFFLFSTPSTLVFLLFFSFSLAVKTSLIVRLSITY